MNNSFLIDFQSMTIEQIKSRITSQDLSIKELEAYNKGIEMIDKVAQLNNESANRVWLSLILYTIHRLNSDK